jgi:hypothetical protein
VIHAIQVAQQSNCTQLHNRGGLGRVRNKGHAGCIPGMFGEPAGVGIAL